jgi:Zn-dependent membrane protease YugP
MPFLLLLLLILTAVFGPQLWAKHVLSKYSLPRDDLDSTGIELARRLLDGLQLSDVKVELTDDGDHYDSSAKAVRLNRKSAEKQSLTSLVVASHEVGHAIQDATGYEPLRVRNRMVVGGQVVQKIGASLMMAMPVVAVLTRSPRVGLFMFLVGLGTLGTSLVVHLVTLPVEWDASFRRALPLLASQRLIPVEAHGAAREILTACALTYVASSLASLLNFWRWIAILRR